MGMTLGSAAVLRGLAAARPLKGHQKRCTHVSFQQLKPVWDTSLWPQKHTTSEGACSAATCMQPLSIADMFLATSLPLIKFMNKASVQQFLNDLPFVC